MSSDVSDALTSSLPSPSATGWRNQSWQVSEGPSAARRENWRSEGRHSLIGSSISWPGARGTPSSSSPARNALREDEST
eukprot:scaffold231943_cov32-Tisochrysis_lutea.AAC.1